MTTCLNGELFFQVSAVSRCSLDCLNMQPTCNIGMQLDCCIISLINNFKRKNLKDFPEGMIKFQERRAVRHAVVTRLYNACTLS